MSVNQYETVVRMSQLASTKDRNGLLPLSRATIWRLSSDPNSGFPRPFKLGPKTTVWRLSEVYEWLASKAKGGSHDY
jgi:predicted DNA-binding transcriptional regulator AlpA